MIVDLKKAAVAEKLIDEDTHAMLLKDLPNVLRQTGIPERFVWTSVRKYCTDAQELAYLKGMLDPASETQGMVYLGNVDGASVPDRMMSIAGVCLRNYVNAKVMTVQSIIFAMKSNTMPTPTVLLVPNFFLAKGEGGNIASWEISGLLGMLYKRQQEGKQTIVYVGDMGSLEKEYGKPFVDHFSGSFVTVSH